MNLAKSLIVSEKTISIIAHLCSDMAIFGRKSYLPASLIDPILKNKAGSSILLKESNYRPYRVCIGCSVNNLLKLWVCKLYFLNRIPVMAPILAPILGVHFFRGHISLKNGTFCPFSSHDSSSFKDTCLFIYLKEAKVALYGPHLHWRLHRLFHNCPKHVVCQLGIDSGSCKS
jgi:hypothetical protein